MANVYNTAYRVKVDTYAEADREIYNIEEGAFVTTEAGVWTVYKGEWVKLYPQSGTGSGLGWTRYDDNQYDVDGKLSLYYATSDFVSNGSQWKITATGGTAKIWDIIYFIQKTQSYA